MAPPSDMAILLEMLNELALVLPQEDQNGSKTLTLEEANSHHYAVTIKLPKNADVIAIKADAAFPNPAKLFKNTKSECKRADFIVINADDENSVILFIEIKKGSPETSYVLKQLKGAACVLAY